MPKSKRERLDEQEINYQKFIIDGQPMGSFVFPAIHFTPMLPKLEGDRLCKEVAFYRIVLAIELIDQWDEYQKGHPNVVLKGGHSSAQNKRPGTNPQCTDQAHFVQAAVEINGQTQGATWSAAFRTLPEPLQILLGHTWFVPRAHNRGIHRSIDNAQKDLIKEYNTRKGQKGQAVLDVQMVLDYCQNVITKIRQDFDSVKYQYSKCAQKDVETYLKTVQFVHETFQRKSRDFQNPGREFCLDMQNYGDLYEEEERNRRELLKQEFQKFKNAWDPIREKIDIIADID